MFLALFLEIIGTAPPLIEMTAPSLDSVRISPPYEILEDKKVGGRASNLWGGGVCKDVRVT